MAGRGLFSDREKKSVVPKITLRFKLNNVFSLQRYQSIASAFFFLIPSFFGYMSLRMVGNALSVQII